MMNKKWMPSLFVFAVCSAAALAWCVSGEGYGKEKGQEKNEPKKIKGEAEKALAKEYDAASGCFRCHTKGEPSGAGLVDICSMDELKIWETKDKHRLAYLALKGERARIMGKNLSTKDQKFDVLTAKACLACHSVWIPDEDERKQNQLVVEEGVGCVVCHTKDKATWIKEHHGDDNEIRRKKWRARSRSEKESEFGMTDLWDAEKRTRLCVSCHVGNADEGKILTHELFAAGHPPLPSFDMSSFSDAMRHWKYMSEKSDEVRNEFKITKSEVEREQINLVNIGSLVSFRETMLLLGKQARTKDAWPELAQFDCYSCHHDLKLPSWRQERGYAGGKPGRPQVPAWSTALAELALYHSSGNDPQAAEKTIKEFRAELDKVRAAFDAQPFGNAKAIGEATDNMIKFINPRIKALETLPVKDRSVHQRLLAHLVQGQNTTFLDHEAARQVAGAFRAIYTDGWKGPMQDKEIMSKLLDLDDELTLRFKSKGREKFNDVRFAITKDLVEIRTKDLKLKRDQQMLGKFLESNLKSLQDNYSDEMNAYLEKVNNYEPKRFQQQMNKIAELLKKDTPKANNGK